MTRIGFSLSTVLARIRWYGEDSDRFRRDWNTVLRRTLQTVAAELDTVAKLLALNADEQELASIGSDLGGRILPMDGAHAPVTETLAEKISGMDSKELDSSLKSDEFQEWVRQSQHNADAAKSVLDGMADSGGLRTAGTDGRPNGYGEFLQQYWVESAMREAGIDPHHWDPSKGVDHNREDIYKVYAFYAKLYKNDPRMEWIGMANQVGPRSSPGSKTSPSSTRQWLPARTPDLNTMRSNQAVWRKLNACSGQGWSLRTWTRLGEELTQCPPIGIPANTTI